MNRTFTLIKTNFRLLLKGFALAAVALLFSGTDAMAQYTTPGHYYGCCYSNGSNTYDRYAAIEQITIEDGSGNVVFNKTGDACNTCPQFNSVGGHHNVITSTPTFSLSAGATYTFRISTSNPLSSTLNSTAGVWFDFNNDQDFADAGEFVSINNWQFSTGSLQSFTFTVPCGGTTGNTRMRVRTDYYFYGMTAAKHSADRIGGRVYYGETEDYTFTYSVPAGLSSDFFVPDTAYTGTVINMVNSNQSGYVAHDWDIDNDGTYEYSTTNATHIYPSAGTYTVKLRSENCNGIDSSTKTIVIVNPTAPPVADFVTTKNKVEIFDNFQLVDLSTNGATYWNWELINGSDTINYVVAPDLQGGNPYVNRNPLVYTGTNVAGFPKIFPDQGFWNVCLQASNSIGASAVVCKNAYVEVVQTSYSIGPGTAPPANIIGACNGIIYDQGGEFGDYLAPTGNLEALIAPCGAASVTMNFEMFKLNANATLQVYDGTNALGTPLHSGSGFTAGNAPSGPLTASTGTMYLLFNSTAGGVDSGFAARWTCVEGSGAAPFADFSLPADTIYNAVFEDFINTSLNAEGNVQFEWTVNGSLVGVGRDLLNQQYLTNGVYTISLKVINCDGTTSTKTKTFVVAPPDSPTELDFVADNRRPSVGEEITLTATTDKANMWEWAFFPPTGVAATGPATNANNERTFQFSQPGVYAVQLRAYNSVDSSSSVASLVKTGYIIVVEHCIPVISVTTSTDVGISNVKLVDASTVTTTIFENASTTGVAYEDFTSLGIWDVNYGGTYFFEVARSSNTNAMSRKIWIDWNVDGDFDDAGELVASQASGTSSKWAGSFTVPNASNAFEANTVMRVGVSYGTDPNEPCGASSGVANANRIGEFEDYSIRVVNDGDMPEITLIDSDTLYIEQTTPATYVSPGAIALDPSQGNISGDIEMNSDVDQTLTGVYYEVYNVSDASGNPALPVTRVVYVVIDQTAPIITLNGSPTETIEVGTTWTDAGATATDAKDGNLTGAIVVSGVVDTDVLGSYMVTYTVNDNQGNTATAVRTVNVVDTEAPVITNVNADASWKVEVQLQSIFVDVTKASDNYNSIGNNLSFTASPGLGSEASVDTRFQGTTSVTYTATDESNNVTTQVIDYVVRDFIPPVIDLRTLDVVYHQVNNPYTPVSPTASDNLYDATQISLTSTSDVNPYVLGTYADTYTAIDAAGNSSTKVRTVHVVDNVRPVITGKNGSVIRAGCGSNFLAVDYLLFSDDYDDPTVLIANHELVSNNINLLAEGFYSATFRTRDQSGNVSNDFTLFVEVDCDYYPITGSVESLSLEDMLSVSPNPSTGIFNVSVDLPENEDIKVGVYNAVGQQILDVVSGSVAKGEYRVDISNRANGIYYVRMDVAGTIVTKKVALSK